MMAENIYELPETFGPGLREYYSELLKQPVPQRLLDLLAMLDEQAREQSAARDGGTGDQPDPDPQEKKPDEPDDQKSSS